jgi:hypothetical protein
VSLATLTPDALAGLQAVQEKLLSVPQIDVQTDHVIHGGVYTRTITIAPGTVLMGAHILIPTTLIVNGETAVFTGENWIELKGFHVIPAMAGRKQIFVAQEETTISMIFRTDAKTVEEAEKEFTDEAELLMSKQSTIDTITITGA